MTVSHATRSAPRVLWLTSQAGSPSGVRPDLELARGLRRAAIELHVIVPAGSYCAQAAREANCRVIEVPPRGLHGRTGRENIRRYCLDNDIALVHLFDEVAMAAAIPALREVPLPLVTRHARTGGVQWWNPLARLTVLHPRLDRVICTSEAARAELARNRDPASLVTIRPGCDPAWHNQPPANLVSLGLPPDAFVVAAVTDYQGRKGIEYIVDSAQWLPAAAKAHFLLVGAGHENRSVLERVVRSPWRENFHLLGPRTDAPQIVAACAVSVRAALRGDSVPQAVIESMACGVPTVATDVGGLRELVAHGESGIVVKRRSPRAIGTAVTWLYEHPAERLAMGRAARARIAGRFSLAGNLASHLALYRELCPSLRAPPQPGL